MGTFQEIVDYRTAHAEYRSQTCNFELNKYIMEGDNAKVAAFLKEAKPFLYMPRTQNPENGVTYLTHWVEEDEMCVLGHVDNWILSSCMAVAINTENNEAFQLLLDLHEELYMERRQSDDDDSILVGVFFTHGRWLLRLANKKGNPMLNRYLTKHVFD